MSADTLPVAILFLVFNRPDNTAKVFEVIRSARPGRLYIASDGPRVSREGEIETVELVRSIATQVDWPCEVKLLFREENLGCKIAVSSAISWFFESEAEGIILEDDCLPGIDFFRFSKELLEKYRHDERVGIICGTNLYNLNRILPAAYSDESYYFGRSASIWGWATWRRVWKDYDVNISEWSELRKSKAYKKNFTKRKWKFLCNVFDKTQENKVDTWDYQLGFSLLKTNRLCVIPNINLIKNIGFNSDATHTRNQFAHESRNEIGRLNWPLINPVGIFPDNTKDDFLDLLSSSRIVRYFIMICKFINK